MHSCLIWLAYKYIQRNSIIKRHLSNKNLTGQHTCHCSNLFGQNVITQLSPSHNPKMRNNRVVEGHKPQHSFCNANFLYFSPQWWRARHHRLSPTLSWRARSLSGAPAWPTAACLAMSAPSLPYSPAQETERGGETCRSACVSHLFGLSGHFWR